MVYGSAEYIVNIIELSRTESLWYIIPLPFPLYIHLFTSTSTSIYIYLISCHHPFSFLLYSCAPSLLFLRFFPNWEKLDTKFSIHFTLTKLKNPRRTLQGGVVRFLNTVA